jgi:D-xylose transport system permease protein
MVEDPRLLKAEPGLAGFLRDLRRRISQGDIGALPVIVGLVIIWAVFQTANPNFLSARNLTNLFLQIAAMGTISVGIVLVLLLGEVDLSVGAVSGLSAGVMAVLNVKSGVPGPLAILIGIVVGAAIGLLQGAWISRFRVPSFVVTLAGFIAWQGVLLYVLGETGTVNLTDEAITGLAGTFFDPLLGWVIGIVCVAAYAGALFLGARRRTAAGLTAPSTRGLVGRIVVVALLVLIAIAVLNADRGVPLAVLILVGFVVAFDLITRRTRFGRFIYAVGGNAEAARRAGIAVNAIRASVFTIAGALAACGGILAASRLFAVNQSSGGGDLTLNAIAAAVIGGTSLFGGRGTAWSALLGALVIGSISNGMDLLALPSSVKFMITGGVLLVAVTIDAVARQGRLAAGRA